MILATHGILKPLTTTSYDPDAQAFFTAAGITDTTQKNAWNQAVLSLKSNSLWSKFIALYPFIGGTATTHKYNAKDPQDLDASFRIVFSGSITHDANGVTGNGTNGYGNTKIIPSVNFSLNNSSGFIYSRTNVAGGYVDFGVIKSGAPQDRFQINIRNATNLFNTACNSITLTGNANSNSQGLFGISRTSSIGYSQSNNTTQTSVTDVSSVLNANEMAILAVNSGGTIANYSIRNYSFACFGSGLTDAECDTLYTIIQTYQTTLGRQV